MTTVQTASTRTRWLGRGYACSIFLSAFLLFQVQPLIGKSILPWFGGTPSVWTTCMLFFQVLLFVGYAYAHLTTQWLSPKGQAIVHIGLLISAALLLPITPSAEWQPGGAEEPMLRIVVLLASSVGLPFFILSSTGPLLQRWFSQTHPGVSPYRLYALSNFGSLLALVSYPFVFEPALAVKTQAAIWSWGFAAFAVCCPFCAVWMWRLSASHSTEVESAALTESADPSPAPPLNVRLLWFALAMTASVMLLATSNQVCLDVASVPFLWVLPLTLYLLSFILCFDSDRWYSRRLYTVAMAVSLAAVCVVMFKGSGTSLVAQVVIYFSGLFFSAMVCHGELVRLRPAPRYLTSFYLIISAGGAAGGLFVGLAAPWLFLSYFELHVGILACCLLTLVVLFRDQNWVLYAGRPRWAWTIMIVGLIGLVTALKSQAGEFLEGAVVVSRNFYGVLRIQEEHADDPARHQLRLMHGRIVHGLQFLEPSKRLEPTAYYGRASGIGRLLERGASPRKIGVVGLGVGTLAAYGRPGDTFRFYEINPDVVQLANRYFTFLKRCRGEVDVVLGDARMSLEHESPQQFDVLVLDAFSGDAIPAHLLTREAFQVYVGHLKPNGVLAVHISNLHFDLRPVVLAAADELGLAAAAVISDKDDLLGTKRCLWMLLARDADRLADVAASDGSPSHDPLPDNRRRLLWTDDRSNLFQILR